MPSRTRTATHTPPTPRPPSQSQRVVQGVLGRIERGEIKPGERVPTEPQLMRTFGVSRSVVREAVSHLQAAGVLRTQQGVGSFVLLPQAAADLMLVQPQALKIRQKLAMLELRLSLEADAAALAAQRRSNAQLTAMEAALDDFDRLQAAGDSTSEADYRFHELLAEATGNEYFVHVLRSLGKATIPRALQRPGLSHRTRRFGDPTPALAAGKTVTQQEHRAVLDAIRLADPAMARAAMVMHLKNSVERLRAASE